MEMQHIGNQLQQMFSEREHLMAQLSNYHAREEHTRAQAGQLRSGFANNLTNGNYAPPGGPTTRFNYP